MASCSRWLVVLSCLHANSVNYAQAIPAYTVVVGGPSATDECYVETLQQEVAEPRADKFKLDGLAPGAPAWSNYVKGVAALFPNGTKPFNAVIATNVPMGGGLSSSAALEASTFLFLEALNGDTGLR